MALLGSKDRERDIVPPLPPRYRLRDLFMGDYAFNDDGERRFHRRLTEMCTDWTISLTFTLQLANTMSWILLIISSLYNHFNGAS
ncbi:hypothetical protein Trydic_g16501 [Trypoxylus dichotomus]